VKVNRYLKDALYHPVMRSLVCIIFATAWNLLSAFLFLDFLPLNFGYYNTMLSNQGTNNYDVYLFWGWLPTIAIIVFGIFWASGLLGKIGGWLENL